MKLKIGLINIDVMAINLYNSSYNYMKLHQFSKCCKARVRYKKVCEKCNKELQNYEILKGTDENHLLTDEQLNQIKEVLDNGYIEVVGIVDYKDLKEIYPYIMKSQIILPKENKNNLITFYSFAEALKELNKMCIVKRVERYKEKVGYLISGANLFYFELPFSYQYNTEEINRLLEAQARLTKGLNIYKYKDDAIEFIKNFKNSYSEITEITEEKKVLLEKALTTASFQLVTADKGNPFRSGLK